MALFDLHGRVAVVTGAGRGIGEAIAATLAGAGAAVALVDRDKTLVEAAAARLSAAGAAVAAWQADVADGGQCRRLADEVGGRLGDASIVVNNAAVVHRVSFEDSLAGSAWDETFAVNLKGACWIVAAFRPQLGRTRGCIVNVCSIAALQGAPRSAAYAASKAALAQLTRSLAVEFAGDGIRVNAVAPGLVDTVMARPSFADAERLRGWLSRAPSRRTGVPADVAGPVAFLASPAAAFVNGVVLPVDGGFLAA